MSKEGNKEVKICRNGLVALSDRKFECDSELKEEFLSTLNTNTAKTVKGTLLKVDKFEQDINKSVYNFSLQEANELIESEFTFKSVSSVRSNISYIRKYINFCIERNFTNINQFNLINDFKQYVNVNALENKYLTYNQLIDLEEKLVNSCDKLILELLFNGIKTDECINIKDTDIDFNEKSIILTNENNNQRKVFGLTDRCFELLQKTINQTSYLLNNGTDVNRKNPDEKSNNGLGTRALPFPKSIYVLKTAGGNTEDEPIRKRGLQDRVRIVRDWVNNPYITVTNIYISGILYGAYLMMREKGVKKLSRYEVAQLADMYNYCKGFIPAGDDGHLVVNSRVGKLQEIIANSINIVYKI